MDIAFVLINTNLGSEEAVSKDLKKITEVKEVYSLYGVYDIIIRVEAETMNKLKEAIGSKIRSIEDIKSTLTMIVI